MEEQQQQHQHQQYQWEPRRELFEALLLSSPALGPAEAMALLGTCRAARSVGRAASLDALRAVAVSDTWSSPVVPLIRDLEPVSFSEEKLWLQGTSAVRGGIAEDAAARVVFKLQTGQIVRYPLPELIALLRWCPNLVSLRLCNPLLPDVGSFVARELGAIAPLLEVGQLISDFLV